ncbi:unnamed protein product [Caenorhabditis angaria]|uniref:Wiskott-Aldrich syndrome protein family member n=1 Tax=Caenorhabditis angaria TaxID=860376 RepID=A0A9P1MSJ8_9PELO|nr:unnamed protein product [Caenorhabditis angaria]
MPLTKRAVSPVNISRNVIPPSIQRDELQCTANGSIANLIRQLSSLSKHAENIFGEIYHDAMIIHHKTNSLQQRIDRLHSKVTQLDPSNDQATLNEASIRKSFKSSMLVDQHILDRSTFPTALAERYENCDQPPNLDALNPYRESEIPALSLYTNPSFFFDLWKKETLKDVPADRPKRVKSPGDGSKSPKKRRKQLQAGNISGTSLGGYPPERQRYPSSSRVQQQQQNEVFSFPEEYQAPQALGLQLNFRNNQHNHQPQSQMVAPIGMSLHHQDRNLNSRQITQGMANLSMGNRESPANRRDAPEKPIPSMDHLPPPDMSLLSIDDDDDELPPPPPPLLMHSSIVHQLPAEQQPTAIQLVEPSAEPANIPPPPPPPPPIPANLHKPAAAASFASARANPIDESTASSSQPAEPKPADARGDLLAQIQSGIKLKKVRLAEESAAEKAALETNDVAAILKRRMDQVMGNDDSSSEEGADDDEWDD